MAGVNKVILVGNLGIDPEVKHLEGDNTVANFTLATSESYKDRNGNKVEQTEWHSLELWGQQAKIAEQYLKKGSQIYVEGKIKTESWDDKDGNKRYRTKIRVVSFTMLGSKPQDQSTSNSSPSSYQNTGGADSFQSTQKRPSSPGPDLVLDEGDDDLPF